MFRQADLEGRSLTPEERAYAEGLLNEASEIGPVERRVKSLNAEQQAFLSGRDGYGVGVGGAIGGGGPGDRFVASEGFRKIQDPAGRGKTWTTGMIEVGFLTKGTLTEGFGSPGTGTGGGLLPVPQVAPGLVNVLFQPLTIEALLSSGVATGNTVRYAYQGTATSGAAGVGEGGLKPQSSIGIGVADEPIKKVATTVTLSDEILEDVPAVQTFCNAELGRYISIEVERQLLRGTASGNEVQGLLVGRGLPIYTASTATDGNYADQLFHAFNSVRGSAFTEPEWVVMNPADYQTIRLSKDVNGQLYGGGPFFGPYGQTTVGGREWTGHRRDRRVVGQKRARHQRDRPWHRPDRQFTGAPLSGTAVDCGSKRAIVTPTTSSPIW